MARLMSRRELEEKGNRLPWDLSWRPLVRRPMKRFLLLLLPLALVGCLSAPRSAAPTRGPWNLSMLQHPPSVTFGSHSGLVDEVYYEGEPHQGRPTRVFAYLGRPQGPTNHSAPRRPAMLLVHGGGGKAFKEWAEHWAQRGYVALAMDLAGNGPNGRLPDGMPDQADATKFRNFDATEVREMWTYHAVAAVLHGHALLKSLPEVDSRRIGVTGISWGGYLTCIVAGIDPELQVAVPVYGCGHLGDNSVWTDKSLAAMTPESRERWLLHFDPSRYLGGVRCPILFLNGATDFAYPLDSYQKSYRWVPPQHRHVSVIVGLPHGHIWTFGEVDAFVDSALRGTTALPRVGEVRISGPIARAAVKSSTPIATATLNYTTDTGAWQKRSWHTVPARFDRSAASADLPAERPLVGFLAVTDQRGLRVSSEHFSLPAIP